MNKEEVNKMFDEAGITYDDLHEYTKATILTEPYKGITREDVLGVIDRIREWKNGIKD